jgi:acyl-CoA thioesterase FadM
MQVALEAAGKFEEQRTLLLSEPPAQHPDRILELLQETAIAASRAHGYDDDWYQAQRLAWWIRRTLLQFHQAAHARPVRGARLTIETSCHTRGPARSERHYRIHTAAGLDLLTACTEWVLVERGSGRPLHNSATATAPPGVGTARTPPIPHPQLTIAPPLPVAPPTQSSLCTIAPVDLDRFGHVNNARYAAFAISAVAAAWSSAGAGVRSPDGLLSRSEGKAPASPRLLVEQLDLTYLRPAHQGDLLRIDTWLTAIARVTDTDSSQEIAAVHDALTPTVSAELHLARGGDTVARIQGIWRVLPETQEPD